MQGMTVDILLHAVCHALHGAVSIHNIIIISPNYWSLLYKFYYIIIFLKSQAIILTN